MISKTGPIKEWANTGNSRAINFNPLVAYLDFVDGQKPYHLMWWCISLVVHANLVLAVPAILIWQYNAPIFVLGITCLGFFGNLVANMGGMGIRVTLSAFFASLLINMAIILIYVL
jgi:hypothetical protein